MTQDPPVIEVERLRKTFRARGGQGPVTALHDIGFTLAARETLGVVGTSGAGKTTLLRVLGLQMPPDSGLLRIGGTPIDGTTPASVRRAVTARTATVFQSFSLLYNRSVLENTALPLKLRQVPKAERLERAREMLEFVGLGHRADAWPITLSGGEAQRVAIARALVTDPAVLFLDEPTSALDAGTSREILTLLQKVRDRYPVAMLLVAHQLSVVRYMCDRALHLEGGRIRHIGPVRRTTEFSVETPETLWQEGDDA